MKLLVYQGIPASGKTSEAREFLKEKKDWVRVNRDDLRNMRGDYWIPSQEKYITDIEDYIIISALSDGYNVLSDNTNLNPKTIKKLKAFAIEFDAEIEFKMFNISLEEALERDRKRSVPVGDKCVIDFYNKYIKDE